MESPQFVTRMVPDAISNPAPFEIPESSQAKTREFIAEIKGRQWRLHEHEVYDFMLKHRAENVRLFKRWEPDLYGISVDALAGRHSEEVA